VEADLKSDEGRERVLDLVPHADVLVEGFRPGIAERLGLGPDTCSRLNPRLVYARMTAWGQTGPLATRAAHDINFLAASGALAAMLDEGQVPTYPLAAALTFGGGSMFLLLGIAAALYEREHSGRGQVVDAAVADGLSMLLASAYGMLAHQSPSPAVTVAPPFYRTYRCADGQWVAVGALEPTFWAAFLGVLQVDDDGSRDDPSRWPALQQLIADRFSSRSRAHWLEAFAGVDAAVTPVVPMPEVPAEPQAEHRGLFTAVDGVVQPTMAPRFSRAAASASGAARAVTAWDEILPGPVRSGRAGADPDGEERRCP
jgi:alpha-methylacyl-CoA racemase